MAFNPPSGTATRREKRLPQLAAYTSEVSTPQPSGNMSRAGGRHDSVSANGLDGAAVLAEASRVARELHDEVAQALFAIGATARSLLADPSLSTDARAGLERTLRLSGSASRQLRAAIRGLRGAHLIEDGLGPALDALVAEVRGRSQLTCELNLDHASRVAEGAAAEALYRVCRESLTNVERHARAEMCRVSARRSSGTAVVTVEDDGVGMEGAPATDRFGLVFLAEVIEGLGGSLDVARRRPRGTIVTARVPIEAE